MSTRCTLTVRDNLGGPGYSIYRHSDGFPDDVMADLTEAFAYAWAMPRFEADDFAAAIVTAWKLGHTNLMNELPGGYRGGYIRLTGGRDDHADTEYHYEIFPCINAAVADPATLSCEAVLVQCYSAAFRGRTRIWRKLGKARPVACPAALNTAA